MWLNSSLLSSPFCPLNSSSPSPRVFLCFKSEMGSALFTTFTVTNIFLLPLYVLILWIGFRRWRQRCSVAAGTTSHTDVFAYYMVAIEIIGVVGMVVYCFSIYTCREGLIVFGYYALTITYPGQTFFHCLTSIERYLAIVHPITYLGLRTARGVKVRNISIGCVLLLCCAMTGFVVNSFPEYPTNVCFFLLALSLTVISFCSLSALRVLVRLGLWKVGGDREQIDQSKRRAFSTIMIIMGTLVLRMCSLTVINLMYNLGSGIKQGNCIMLISLLLLCLPSCLVLPLLFLHKARRQASSQR